MTAEPQHISQRQLRNDSGAVLRAVQGGARYVITSNGSPVAEIRPLQRGALEGIWARTAIPGARFSDVVPQAGRPDETALESLLFLRGER